MFIGIRSRSQVSVYRTIGPLVFVSVSINMSDYLGSILSYIAISFPIFLGVYDYMSAPDLSALISAVSHFI